MRAWLRPDSCPSEGRGRITTRRESREAFRKERKKRESERCRRGEALQYFRPWVPRLCVLADYEVLRPFRSWNPRECQSFERMSAKGFRPHAHSGSSKQASTRERHRHRNRCHAQPYYTDELNTCISRSHAVRLEPNVDAQRISLHGSSGSWPSLELMTCSRRPPNFWAIGMRAMS